MTIRLLVGFLPAAGASAVAAHSHAELVMWTFRAMNTDVTVSAPHAIDADEHAFAIAAARHFAAIEQQ
jgi:hypothetical protein